MLKNSQYFNHILHMPETIVTRVWVGGDAAVSFAMWTLLQATHIQSVMGLLASLPHQSMNTGACP